MAQGYFLTRHHHARAVFDLFYRNNPFKGGYVIAAGITEVMQCLSGFQFQKDDLEYLKAHGFQEPFLKYLKSFRFNFNVDSVLEGEVVFPREPILRTEGTLLECQLAETILINLVHFPSLVATKASRCVRAAEGRSVVDFGLRRAQGLAGLHASRAAYIGGIDGSSNVLAGKTYGIPIFGTQAHSWIQAYQNEEKAFLDFARIYKNNTTLLIDTYSTLKSGLPHLIQAAKKLRKEGIEIKGVRLDSGDLAYLSKKVRQALDEEGFSKIQIIVSGNLDEYLVESLLKQNAKVDGFGIGTKLVTSYDEPALDMVYKLSTINGNSEIKISDSLEKMNEPGKKKIWRYLGDQNEFLLDSVLLEDEKKLREVYHPFFKFSSTPVTRLKQEPLLSPLMRKGKVVREQVPIYEMRAYAKARLAQLPDEHKRFHYPHTYRVGVSPKLFRLKERLIAKRRA